MKKIKTLLIVVVLMCAGYASASACVCALSPKSISLKNAVAKAKSEAAVVFSGQAIELDNSIVKFRVERLWKGAPTEKIVLINTGTGKSEGGDRIISSCAYNFRLGEKYLVYAYRSEGKLETNKCTRTAVMERAAEDVTDSEAVRGQSGMPSWPDISTVAVSEDPPAFWTEATWITGAPWPETMFLRILYLLLVDTHELLDVVRSILKAF